MRDAMDPTAVDTTCLQAFLQHAAQRTASDWRHLFITTNWDYLLQREILNLRLKVLPHWLENSHVFHLNGTVEEPEGQFRSPFLLETDPATLRCHTPEADKAFNHMMWETDFVVVGMSFECEMDRFLLWSLQHVQDMMPIGESRWLLVNPDVVALDATRARIQQALPAASITTLALTFEDWLGTSFAPLPAWGVFPPNS